MGNVTLRKADKQARILSRLTDEEVMVCIRSFLTENSGATYFRVVREERVTDRLFLGSISKLKLTVRAYKSK